MHAPGLFDLTDHWARFSATGDPLEALDGQVDFEAFRPVLVSALGELERLKVGRPPYDPMTMFKVLIRASMHNLSDERMEFFIWDWFSGLRFPGLQFSGGSDWRGHT